VDVVQLTQEQVDVATALGCRFVEANEAQVRQFSMQRRVFQIDGKAYLAARADGFYETAGTLIALIAQAMEQTKAPAAEPEQPVAAAEAELLPADEEVASADTDLDEEQADWALAAEAPSDLTMETSAQAVAGPAPSRQSALAHVPGPVLSAMTTITKGYVRGHVVDAAQLSALLVTVHKTLSGLVGTPRRPLPTGGDDTPK
jgi:hypothetical protein